MNGPRRELSPQLEVFKGTLDLMVLRDSWRLMGAMHGFGIARRNRQVSGESILLNQGTIYASLVRFAAARVDPMGSGVNFGQQPKGEILFHHQAVGQADWWRRRRIGGCDGGGVMARFFCGGGKVDSADVTG
jgi:hypothetical protein